MLHWIETHGFEMLVGYYLFATVVGALPTPANGNQFYKFFFNFMHGLAANALRIPQFRSFMGIQSSPTTIAGIAAQADAQAIDPSVQGITQKPPEPPNAAH